MTERWHVYIALLADGRYYVGMTSLPPDVRAVRHRSGLGGKFTGRNPLVKVLWFETHLTSQAARTREQQIKRWSHAKKQALIAGDTEQLKRLSRRKSGGRFSGAKQESAHIPHL